MSNVFVLCTGRCGSLTLSKALACCTNYSVAHESVWFRCDVSYPPQHIEVNNRLVWYLGRLMEKYPDAKYVHLTRNSEAVAQSMARRKITKHSILSAWRYAVRMSNKRDAQATSVLYDCRDYVSAVNSQIRCFLNYTQVPSFSIDIEDADVRFRALWRWIGCEGDIDMATAIFQQRHNQGTPS